MIIALVDLFAPQAVALFTNDPAVVDYGVRFTQIILVFMLFNCINHVLAGGLRGMGDSKGPMIIMLLSFVAIRQTYLYVMTHYISNTAMVVGFGYPVGWMSCCIIEVSYFFLRRKKLLSRYEERL